MFQHLKERSGLPRHLMKVAWVGSIQASRLVPQAPRLWPPVSLLSPCEPRVLLLSHTPGPNWVSVLSFRSC